jgi:pyruvate/2-oxoglutarate dehydrogenase complex dihydrolipoamide acyltransferase (E2) component
MSEFRMPSLGADMQYGTVVEWRVKPGDAVKRGDVVALVETEKGVIEVEIFESGVIESLVIQPGQKVPVGTTLATLSGDGKRAAPQAASIADGSCARINDACARKRALDQSFHCTRVGASCAATRITACKEARA